MPNAARVPGREIRRTDRARRRTGAEPARRAPASRSPSRFVARARRSPTMSSSISTTSRWRCARCRRSHPRSVEPPRQSRSSRRSGLRIASAVPESVDASANDAHRAQRRRPSFEARSVRDRRRSLSSHEMRLGDERGTAAAPPEAFATDFVLGLPDDGAAPSRPTRSDSTALDRSRIVQRSVLCRRRGVCADDGGRIILRRSGRRSTADEPRRGAVRRRADRSSRRGLRGPPRSKRIDGPFEEFVAPEHRRAGRRGRSAGRCRSRSAGDCRGSRR